MKYSKEFIETQKASLLAEKKKIVDEIKKLEQYPDYGNDEEDSLQELNDYESNLIIDSEMELLLTKINNALAAIEKGTYGTCSKCNEAISEGRLKVMPWADICVSCGKEK